MQRRYLTGLLVLVALALGLPLVAQAVPVGRFVQVEGSVDLMKGGKFPAVPVKLQDGVEQGDAVRTKSLSRAQIQFVDDTLLTLAAESRVAIDEYVYDASHSRRQATVEIFRGLVHFAVSKIFQIEKPDFIMKSQTGILGVRGTKWYAQLTPLHTDIYNEQGTTEVSNLFPEVPGKVTLTGMQFTRVGFNLPPTLPLPITEQDLKEMRMQFSTRGGGAAGGSASPLETGTLGTNPALGPGVGIVGPGPGGPGGPGDPASNPTFSTFTANPLVNNPANNPLIPSQPITPPGPISGSYAFTMDLYGYHTNTISSPGAADSTSASWGLLTGVDPEYFTSSGSGTRASASFTGSPGTANTFTATDILTGTVSGASGQSLTGTYSASWTNSMGYTGTFSGPITINPNGTFNFSYTNLSGSNGTTTVTGTGSDSGTPGTYFTQTATGSLAMTGNASGKQQTITNNSDPTNGTYSIWGTRTGVYPGTFSAGLSMTETAPVTGYYPPADQGSLTATMQGVVSGPTGGSQTGVMTTVAGGQGGGGTQYTLMGPVTINPDGSLNATFYGNNTNNAVSPAPAGLFTQQGSWRQVSQAIPEASTYSFSIPLTDSDVINATSTTQATVGSEGVGLRTGVYPGTYLTNVENGTLTGPSGSFTVGGASSTSVSGTLSGTVSGVLGGSTLSGSGTFSGTSTTGQTLSYTGPITISPNGTLTFNYNGSVTQSGQPTLTAAGTMTESFALPISQSASGSYQVVAVNALLNTSQMTGSQTVSGGSPTATNGSLALTYGGGGFGLPSMESGSGTFSVSGAGAVSPWYGGQPTNGVISSTVTVGTASVSQMPMQVTYNPTTGNLTGQMAVGGGSGSFINAVLAATPTGSGQTTTSFYQTTGSGSYAQTSSSPYSTASITGSGFTGTMYLGGSGAIVPASITAGFNFTGTSTSGAFPASSSGTVIPNNLFGAVVGPASGTQNGWAMFSANYTPSGSSSSYFLGLSGPFALGPASATPPYPGTLTVASATGISPNGYPMTLSGTWTQSDPPLTGTTTSPGAAATGLTLPAQAWWLQRAAWLPSPAAATAGAEANAPLLSARFTRLTGTSLGSRIQGAAQLTQFGASANPALAANLRAASRFRRQQQHRHAVLRAASGGHPRGPGG